VPEAEAEVPYRQPGMDGHRESEREEGDGKNVQVSPHLPEFLVTCRNVTS